MYTAKDTIWYFSTVMLLYIEVIYFHIIYYYFKHFSSPGWGSLDKTKCSGVWGTSMLLYHTVRYRESFEKYDYEFRSTCCSVGLCELFYNRRPLNNCSAYVPPRLSKISNAVLL